MPESEPITAWIERLKEGDSIAAERLWEQYFGEAARMARRKLEGAKKAVADEEDIALSAFKSLCVGAEAGRFPKLTDRDSLWSLLMTIVAHKSVDQIRHENRQKRGGAGEPVQAAPDAFKKSWRVTPLSQMLDQRPTPEMAAMISSQLELLIQKLDRADDPTLLKIALAKLMGDSNKDIAEQLACVQRTVERKIRLIRTIWEKEIDSVE